MPIEEAWGDVGHRTCTPPLCSAQAPLMMAGTRAPTHQFGGWGPLKSSPPVWRLTTHTEHTDMIAGEERPATLTECCQESCD
jgi:hypothetical protein